MDPNITIIIHTYNAEEYIRECIESARLLTKNIHLIDMESTDKTVEIARKSDVPIFSVPLTHYVEPAREFGIRTAKTDWIFILDADERITPELADEIAKITNYELRVTNYQTLHPRLDRGSINTTFNSHYKVPRKNIFGRKKWLKHGGWWPDYQTRLINLAHFKSWPKHIHSTPQIEGTGGLLKNPILHYFHGDIANMVQKTILFEDIESDLLYKAGREGRTPTFFRKFLGELYRRLIRHGGFLDGEIGIIESVYQAFSKTITYLYLYEKKTGRPL